MSTVAKPSVWFLFRDRTSLALDADNMHGPQVMRHMRVQGKDTEYRDRIKAALSLLSVTAMAMIYRVPHLYLCNPSRNSPAYIFEQTISSLGPNLTLISDTYVSKTVGTWFSGNSFFVKAIRRQVFPHAPSPTTTNFFRGKTLLAFVMSADSEFIFQLTMISVRMVDT